MKNIITTILVCYVVPTCAQSDYGPVEAHNDSMRIYEAYQQEFEEFGGMDNNGIEAWRKRQMTNDSLTACAKRRLQKYNGQSYEPKIIMERTGLGEAYGYPNPNWDLDHETGARKYFYCSYDEQTRFMRDSAGRMIPYIRKLEFKNSPIPIETKLDPITYAVLKQ